MVTDWGDSGDTENDAMTDQEALAAAKGKPTAGKDDGEAIIDARRAEEIASKAVAASEARRAQQDAKRELDTVMGKVCSDAGLDDDAAGDVINDAWKNFTADAQANPAKFGGKSPAEVRSHFADLTKQAIEAKRKRWGGKSATAPEEDEEEEVIDQADANAKARKALGQEGKKAAAEDDDDAPRKGRVDADYVPPAFGVEVRSSGEKQTDFYKDLKHWGKTHGVRSA